MLSRRCLYFGAILCLLVFTSSCGGTSYVSFEPHAGPITVSASVNSNGEFVLGGSYSRRLIGTSFLGADLVVGFEKTLNEAKNKSNYLFVVWEDELGDVWRDKYNIGEQFTVNFGEEHWVRQIHEDNNGNVIVSVEIHRISGRNARASRPTLQEIEKLPNLWNKAGYSDITSPTGSDPKSYFVTIDSDTEWRWGFSWSAVDRNTLQEILAPFSLELFVNGEKLSDSQILTYEDTTSKGWPCVRWVTKLSNWPDGGRVELEVRYRLTERIHDGQYSFSPGLYRQVIVVMSR
jgi:hypothetical protein